MIERLKQVLQEQGDNYILPFFWQHGEEEEVLRDYVRAIHDANIGALCIESRPHEEFGKEKWWQDVDIILEECKNYGMKVWILDDKHFPTGYANGILEGEDASLQRKHLYFNSMDFCGPMKAVSLDVKKYVEKRENPFARKLPFSGNRKPREHYADDTLVAVIAAPVTEDGAFGEAVDLTDRVGENGCLSWDVPGGMWHIWVIFTTHNAGSRPYYIHMIDKASCAKLIEAVYEPHWEHYKEEFGKTLVGFFSDDISFYNMDGIEHTPNIGGDMPLPWSDEVEQTIKAHFGEEWRSCLSMLWSENEDKQKTSAVRFRYMDTITKLVQENFSNQIGDWCRGHGVQYIGHGIDEEEFHSRIGRGLGHFFRSLDGETMGGIDAIVGQVTPGGDHYSLEGRNGEANHFTLAKLGSSHGHIDPKKNGNTMCEVFGAFGWGESLRTMKFITDHFLVNGVNYYVPHAFSPKAYPDPDCPPHFYAHGYNPLYRPFGKLMAYMNRVCHLISGGRHIAPVAMLYHAESEWAGAYMATDRPARILQENQIDFDILPADVFAERNRFLTQLFAGKLAVNKEEYRVLVIPYAQYITKETAQFITEAKEAGFPVWFLKGLPEGICGSEEALPEAVLHCPVVSLETLPEVMKQAGYVDVSSDIFFPRLRYYRYRHEQSEQEEASKELYLLANLDTAETYSGRLYLPTRAVPTLYDTQCNVLRPLSYTLYKEGVQIELTLPAYQSAVVVFGCEDEKVTALPTAEGTAIVLDGSWRVSVCHSKTYPQFREPKVVEATGGFQGYQTIDPDFSGFIAYETKADLSGAKALVLEEVSDAAEVFVNGKSLGIQYCPPFLYDLREIAAEGESELRIEVATTLEREVAVMSKEDTRRSFFRIGGMVAPTGLVGKVTIYS
ncbi:MAG: glycosyl hydrolase [Lachnospiraceae bacterium]|nr:glycosyl hydrolase [Lachnospiraceae bacterium]